MVKPETFDGTIAAQKAISCVYRTGQRFGVTYLIDVLLGSKDQRIINFRHDELSVYGIGKELSKQEWQSVFRHLVAMEFLRVDMEGHGGIQITEMGRKFLKEKTPIQMRKYAGKVRLKNKNVKSTISLALETEEENELFDQLKAKRMEIALQQKVPPYMVFHDKTLFEMIKVMPKSLDEMSQVSGVGEAKIKSYGKLFLQILVK